MTIKKKEIITVPIYLVQHYKTKKDKLLWLNMNWYRNAHYIVSNNMKRQFKEQIKEQLLWIVYYWQLTVNYKLYWKRLSDLDNLQAVVTKFFQDALVECGCIEDDNFNYIRMNTYEVVAQDKINPRMEVTINKYICKDI
jgi:hypothetical protein